MSSINQTITTQLTKTTYLETYPQNFEVKQVLSDNANLVEVTYEKIPEVIITESLPNIIEVQQGLLREQVGGDISEPIDTINRNVSGYISSIVRGIKTYIYTRDSNNVITGVEVN
jgi:hypothetical protein